MMFAARKMLALGAACSLLLVALGFLLGCGDDNGTTGPDNRAPVITDVTATPDTVMVSGTSTLTCTAADEDGDSLSCAWSPEAGSITGAGLTVTWNAPDTADTYVITATVTDGRGGEATDSVDVTVVTQIDQAPVIDSLKAVPPVVGPGESTLLTCYATDPEPDALAYRWSADEGVLTGGGPTVEWTAPAAEGTYIVSVTVSNEDGDETSDSLIVDVVVGRLLVKTREGLMAVSLSGDNFLLSTSTAYVEVLDTRIFLSGHNKIIELDHQGEEIQVIQSTLPDSSGYLTMLPDGGFVFISNRYDEMYFNAPDGTFLETVPMHDYGPDNSLQNIDGVTVGNRLIVSETGFNEVIAVDLVTREVSVFQMFDDGLGWLGAIDYYDGTYYLCRSQLIHHFTEGGETQDLCTLPEGNITGIVAVGSYMYVVVNFEGTLYRVDRITGDYELMLDGLDYPQDIEFIPVDLVPPGGIR